LLQKEGQFATNGEGFSLLLLGAEFVTQWRRYGEQVTEKKHIVCSADETGGNPVQITHFSQLSPALILYILWFNIIKIL
jgi:hypothetical protein